MTYKEFNINKIPTLLMLVVLLIGSRGALAVTVENLYVADVFVTSQNPTQLASGAKAGLIQVLVRASGNDQVANNDVIVAALQNPESYYYQYSYQTTDREFQIGEEMVSAKILRLHFQPTAIIKLLREAELPIWGNNRPGVLVWLALDDDGSRRLVSETETNEVVEAINTLAINRGVPLLYPLLDLEDASQISATEVWGSFKTQIDLASERYSPDSILTGRIQKLAGDRWQASWSYRIDNRWYSGNFSAVDGADLAKSIVDDLADALAERYAFGASRQEIDVYVDGIESVQDYAGALAYLESLAPVTRAQVLEVKSDQVLFRLNLQGQTAQLTGLIKLDAKMTLTSAAYNTGRLHYQWMR